MRFWKYQGAGNDFVLLDCIKELPPSDLSCLAKQLCDRRCGIGADGVLLLLPSDRADFRMRIFNADGSEPSMCGNGIRCLAQYVFSRYSELSEITIETSHASLRCRKHGDQIAVNLGAPSILHWQLQLEGAELFVVHTGVPHAVMFVDNLDEVEVEKLGRQIRFHPYFFPEGANVNFASVAPSGQISVRTYERGVEGETLACGTGAAATAFVALKKHNLQGPISVHTRTSFIPGAIYKPHMHFQFCNANSCEIEMIGTASEVFEGKIKPVSR
jgi:diaminopimelate epimerase